MSNNNQLALPGTNRVMGFFSKGLPEKLEPYFYQEDRVCDFAISGQGADAALIHHLLAVEAGNLPVIILHNNKMSAKAEAALVWTAKFGSLDAGGTIWSCDDGGFEPFLGMDAMDITQIFRKIAESQNMNCSPQFEKIISAHLKILQAMDCEYSLSGLYYLCSFEDLEEFQSNILQLPCSDWEKNMIISSLGLTQEQSSEHFELFRTIVQRFAREAKTCGWSNDNSVGEMNITTALDKRAMMLLNVSATRAPMILTYLREELSLLSDQEFLLIIDDVHLENSGIIPILAEAGRGFRFVLMGDNILEMIGSDVQSAQIFCGKLKRIILLKHGVATAAEALVALLGTHEVQRETRTTGTGQNFFSLLPSTQSKSVAISKEDRHRIEAKELLNLQRNKAIVFDTETNAVIRI